MKIIFFDKIINSAKLAWKGEERLWKIFWLWGLTLSVIYLSTFFVMTKTIFAESEYNYYYEILGGGFMIFLFYFFVYIYSSFLYRCAYNEKYENSVIPIFRIILSLGTILIFAGFFSFFYFFSAWGNYSDLNNISKHPITIIVKITGFLSILFSVLYFKNFSFSNKIINSNVK